MTGKRSDWNESGLPVIDSSSVVRAAMN
jgi:hypothetical protein